MALTFGRIRLLQLSLGLTAMALAAWRLDPPFYTSWWLVAGGTTALSATLIEPHYTAPRSVIVNSAVPITAFFLADHAGVESLWIAILALGIFLLIAAVLVVTDAVPPHSGRVLNWVATRFGRAATLGAAVLLAEAVRLSSIAVADGTLLLIMTGVMLAAVAPDWPRVLMSRNQRRASAILEAAVAPDLLLFSSEGRLEAGSLVEIQKGSERLRGYVAGRLDHKHARRYQIVVQSDWRTLLPEAGAECTITPLDETDDVAGFAVEGSSELGIRLHPVRPIDQSAPLVLRDGDRQILYQVTGLRLEKDQWDASIGLQARVSAVQVGELMGSSIAPRPWLPQPFHAVSVPDSIEGTLPGGFELVGYISGTRFPIGIKRNAEANDGHLAIVGMSGMGKTNAAQLVARAFDAPTLFVGVDATGEYASRLGWATVDPVDWTAAGCFVHEPRVDLAERCRSIIKEAMLAANAEYVSGPPSRRVILLEEAHSFLPEWTFTTSYAERDTVSDSARYILQARKFGLSFVFVSQRTAVISKSAISQCENFIVFRTIDQTSLDFVGEVVGSDFRAALPSLKRYQALCVGPLFNTESPVIVDLVDTAPPPSLSANDDE